MDKIRILKNPIQDYAWGSKTFIPQLMGRPALEDTPQAELWMGAHPKAPSLVLCDGEWVPLPQLIQKDPERVLGKFIAKKFSNRLPFLFKVLAAARPLSIQAHPNLEQARIGFDRESKLKTPLNDPLRNYRDENHKPEVICALTPFWALSGFRDLEGITALAHELGASFFRDQIIGLQGQSDEQALRGLFTTLMTMDRGRQRQTVGEVVEYCKNRTNADSAFAWIAKLNQAYPGDISVLSPMFMNVIRLKPGEAMCIPAGHLHAYLDGAGIELMANSDNVLRGGLTPKNIDVPELLKILDFKTHHISLLEPKKVSKHETLYQSPAEEFMLSVISIGEGSAFEGPRERSVEIMICTEGDAHIIDLEKKDMLSLKKGTAIIIPASAGPYRIKGKAIFYKAAVPH